jgi:chromosome segregation ATPase
MTSSVSLVGAALLFLVLVWSQAVAAKTFYRYTNSEGVTVLDLAIPPEYSQNGYELVNERGEVLKVVAPALSPEAAAAEAAERKERERLEKWDQELLLRYSSVRDIEAAKQRKLAQIQNNVAILRGNISNLRRQISEQHAIAAKSERVGKEVSSRVLNKIEGLEEQLQVAEAQLQEREQQYQEMEEKFVRDQERFRLIRPDAN